MSQCLAHEPCPDCRKRGQDRSGDNLGVYEDHKFCFACGYWEPIGLVQKYQFHTVEKKNHAGNWLPDDCSSNIRLDALAWLKKYGLTDAEIEANGICWSERGVYMKKLQAQVDQLLCFPLMVEDKLEAWQGRYFGKEEKYPKYVSYGIKENLFYILSSKSDGPLVLVEDLISAIKVSRQTSAMPLFTSNISRNQCLRLSKYYDEAVIWLDPNMRQQSIKLQQRLELFFRKVSIVYSDKDPKDYSDGEINGFLHLPPV